MNHFNERGNDENQQASPNNILEVPLRSITRSKTKKIQKKLIGMIQDIWVNKL